MTAPRLRETQKDLYALVTGFGAGPKAQAPRIVVGTRALNPLKRVRIYGDQYFWRMYEALTQDFPKVSSQLEEQVLRSVVRRYARACPSRHWDLGRFGSSFPQWLKANRVPGARADFADLSRLEWARNEVFLAPDAPPIDISAIARHAPEALPAVRLQFVPACQHLKLEHQVAALFEALKGKKKLPPRARQPQALVVWRKGFEVFHSVIGPEESKALTAAMAGKPLAAVVAHFGQKADPAKAAFAAVGSWVAEGMVAAAV